MKYILLSCLLLSVQAHVPSVTNGGHDTRDSAYHVGDIVDKSWGIYSKSSTPMWFMFVGHKGDKLSLSLSTITDESRNGLLNATLHGMHVADIVCKDGWTGWGARRLDSDHEHTPKNQTEETFYFPTPSFKEKKFEPFGVGVYIPVTACETTFPSTGTFFLEVTPLQTDHDTYFTVGAGMTEAFSVWEILTMPYILYPTYAWSLGNTNAAILVIFPFLLIVFGVCAYIWYHEVPGGLQLNVWRGLVLASMVFLIPSPVIFLILLINAGVDGGSGAGMAATFFIHIFFPVVFITLMTFLNVRVQDDDIPKLSLWKFFGLFAMTIYAFVGIWQSYLIGNFLLVMGLIAYTIALVLDGKFKYTLL